MKYFFRKYKYDIIGSFVALISLLVPILLNTIYSLLVSLVIIVFSLLFIIIQKSKDKEFYRLSMQKRKDIENWSGSGLQYKTSQGCFYLQDADPGIVFSPTLNWSNYRLNFNFKIEKDCIGVIVRAVNLSNYIMLQIRNNCVRPHIRINGGWSIFEPETTQFWMGSNLSLDSWYNADIKCENDSVKIVILREDKEFFNRVWQIPKGSIIFDLKESDNQKENKLSVKIPFMINLEYGAVGFRNNGCEAALIKEVLVEKI